MLGLIASIRFLIVVASLELVDTQLTSWRPKSARYKLFLLHHITEMNNSARRSIRLHHLCSVLNVLRSTAALQQYETILTGYQSAAHTAPALLLAFPHVCINDSNDIPADTATTRAVRSHPSVVKKEKPVRPFTRTVVMVGSKLPLQIIIANIAAVWFSVTVWLRWLFSACTVSPVIMTFSNPFRLPNNPFP